MPGVGPEGSSARSDVKHTIARGECLVGILARYGVGSREAHQWYRAARPERDLGKLAIGHDLRLSLSQGGQLVELRYDIDDEQCLVVERRDGELAARIENRPVQVRTVGVRGTVRSTFFESARQAGVPDRVIAAMVDLLGFEVSFSTDARPGDRFRVLYEERTSPDGRQLKPGRILAADYVGRARSAAAFLYRDEQGKDTYVDNRGRTLAGALLRYPLEFTRISSTFSRSRYHPILKRRRPHRGVDFAAPTGTPVRAIGAGVVRWAAWKGSLGRHVEIDHGGGLVSAYSHLRRIHRATRRKGRVERGQVIGWVGQSGQATGPHLHFAAFQDGRYVNPLKLRRPLAVAQVDPEKFKLHRDELAARLQAVTTNYRSMESTRPVVLSALAQARHLGPVKLTF